MIKRILMAVLLLTALVPAATAAPNPNWFIGLWIGFNTAELGTGYAAGAIDVMSITRPTKDDFYKIVINNPYGHGCETDNGWEYWRGFGEGRVDDDTLYVAEMTYACGDEPPVVVAVRLRADRKQDVIREWPYYPGGVEATVVRPPTHIFHRVSKKKVK